MYFYVFDRRTKVGTNNDEAQAKAFLDKYSEEYSKLVTENTRASWNYDTNLTDHNAAVLVNIYSIENLFHLTYVHVQLYTCIFCAVLYAGRSQRSPVSLRRRSKQPSVFV
jgi:hypothetical protein